MYKSKKFTAVALIFAVIVSMFSMMSLAATSEVADYDDAIVCGHTHDSEVEALDYALKCYDCNWTNPPLRMITTTVLWPTVNCSLHAKLWGTYTLSCGHVRNGCTSCMGLFAWL